MTLYFRNQGTTIIVYGNTYPVRERLKALGARFNGQDKNWLVPHTVENLTLIEGLCTTMGGSQIGTAVVTSTGTASMLAFSEGPAPAERTLTTERTPHNAAARMAVPPAVAAATGALADDSSLTIRQLMERASFAINQAFPRSVWVIGEIQNASRRASGLFFDLAESGSDGQHQNATVTVRAILWKSALAQITAKRGATLADDILQDGLKVRLLVQVQLYRDRGQISLTIDDVDPAFTKGSLALAREKLLKELRAKGLDAAQARLPLPPFPFQVGLISADKSRAQSDFMDQLQALRFPGEVLFHNAPMQGEAVPLRVVAAMQALTAQSVDLIVLTRGGGSAADLRWFDAPEIAYAIARCPIPVIAAIGHHDDFCVAEMVCHLRQKTPTAAADFVVSLFLLTRQKIDHLAATLSQQLMRRANDFNALQAQISGRLAAAASESIGRREQRLLTVKHRLSANALEAVQALARKATERLNTLKFSAERALNARVGLLQALEQKIVRLDPKPWLAQGWTQLWIDKRPVRRVAEIKPGDQVKARLIDGRAALIVERVETTETNT